MRFNSLINARSGLWDLTPCPEGANINSFHHRREVPTSRFSRGTGEMRKAMRRRPALEALESRQLLTTVVDQGNLLLSTDSFPTGITTGSDGQIWFSQTSADEVGMLNPFTGHMGTSIRVGSNPDGIVSAANKIWFAEAGSNAIGEIQPSGGGGTYLGDFTTPTGGSGPSSLVSDPKDGNIYFTEVQTGKIGWFNPSAIQGSYDIHEVSLPGSQFPGSTPDPLAIAVNPNDGTIWFTTAGTNQIGSFNPASQTFNHYDLPSNSLDPVALAFGPDGNLWITDHSHLSLYGNGQVQMLNPGTGQFGGAFALPASAGNPLYAINGIAAGPDGNMWVTVDGIGQIAWFNPVNPQGTLQWQDTPNQASNPSAIAVGPDGNVWFTETKGRTAAWTRGTGRSASPSRIPRSWSRISRQPA